MRRLVLVSALIAACAVLITTHASAQTQTTQAGWVPFTVQPCTKNGGATSVAVSPPFLFATCKDGTMQQFQAASSDEGSN
jgi:hypothetical protein